MMMVSQLGLGKATEIRCFDVSQLDRFADFLIMHQASPDNEEADMLHTASAWHALRLALLVCAFLLSL